jgi:glycosyltransferase involved in cell wall biosynthesis
MMCASKVFVLPSEREGFGIVVTEANAAGIPVVTVDMPDNAAKYLIEQGENGLVCELSPEAIATAIETLLHDRKPASYYAAFSEKYDWKNIIPQMEEVYGK